jgi:hypothetical protein
MTIRLCCKRYCTVNNISLTLTALGIISSIVTISVFSDKLLKLAEYDYLYDYRSANCQPISGRALNFTCNSNPLVENWMLVLTLDNNLQAVQNPFALKSSRAAVITDRDKIAMLGNYSCLCRAITSLPIEKGCSYWPACIFDVDFVYYMQRDNDRYYQTYISFIVASSISLVLAAISVPFTICIIRKELRHDYVALT